MKYFSFILFIFILLSCKPDSEEKNNEEPKIEIISSEEDLLFTDSGGIIDISFLTNVSWTATSNQYWCKISHSYGEDGTNVLNVSADANTEYEERSAVIKIKCATLEKSFLIKQKQKDAIVLTSSKIEVNDKGGEISINVKSNVPFEYEIEESTKVWLTPKTLTRSLTTSTLHFMVAENADVQKRQGIIKFHHGSTYESIEIYQEGVIPTLILTQNEYVVSDAGEEIKVELKNNVPYEMCLPDVDWIKEVRTRAMHTGTHYFTIAPNNAYDNRQAYILFLNKENGISEKVTIIQNQKNVIVLANNEYTIGFVGGKLDFEVNTNVDFDLEISADWIIKLPTTRGLKLKELHFNIVENSKKEIREGKIILSCGDLKQEIKIVQLINVIGEAIDLGLSVKWASHNIGASLPEEYGGLYGLGDPTGAHTEIPGDHNNVNETWEYYGGGNFSDGKVSGTSFDIARVKWGQNWRLPTYYEFLELYQKCSWKWTTYNEISGYVVTGSNGKSIFLPAGGHRMGTRIESQGVRGSYWSGTIYGEAFSLLFYDYKYSLTSTLERYHGHSVRPVTK